MKANHLKLLIADDHKLFIDGLQLILKEHIGIGYFDFALNGKEAIEKCRKHDFDVVLMDVNMPVIDGIEATREIKRHHKKIKVLIVSMLSDFATVSKVLKAGADGFLIKNADVTEFMKAFTAIQNDEIYISGEVSALFDKTNSGKPITKNDYIQFTENLVSPREQSVLKLIVEGYTNQAIAETLFLSAKTVDTHRNNMLAKLNLPNTASLVKFAIENKLV